MNAQTLKLAAVMLQSAADKFSNHGCNDLEDDAKELMSKWTAEQRAKFLSDAAKWNNGPVDEQPEYMPDWMVMEVLAYQLENAT